MIVSWGEGFSKYISGLNKGGPMIANRRLECEIARYIPGDLQENEVEGLNGSFIQLALHVSQQFLLQFN